MYKKDIGSIEKLLEDAKNNLLQSNDNWKSFLTTSSNVHKYDFTNQMLIHSQNPNAKVCASFDFYSKKLNRTVKNGANGIALIGMDDIGKPKTDYVFALEDTVQNNLSKSPFLWEVKEGTQNAINDILAIKHNDVIFNQDLGSNLMDLTKKMVQEQAEALWEDFQNSPSINLTPFSSLEQTLIASTQFVVLARCGIDPSLYVDDNHLNVSCFNKDEFMEIGNLIQEVSKDLLIEMGNICKHIDKNIEQFQQKSSEPIAQKEKISYNVTIERENLENSKGAISNEQQNNLYESGRLQFSEPNTSEWDGEPSRYNRRMGVNEERVSTTNEERTVRQNEGREHIMEAPLSSGRGSDNSIQHNVGTSPDVARVVEGDGRVERARTDRVEEHGEPSNRGNHTNGIHLRLSDEQLNKIISHSINAKENSTDIVAYFSENFKTSDRVDFLKKLLVDENSTIYKGDILSFDIVDDKLNLYVGDGVSKFAENTITFNELAGYVGITMIPNIEGNEVELLDKDVLSQEFSSVKETAEEILEKHINDNPNTMITDKTKLFEDVKSVMYSELSQECKSFLAFRGGKDYPVDVFTNEDGKEFAFSFANLGNGTTVANMLDEDIDNDWAIVAHVDSVGHISYNDNDLPPLAVKKLEDYANNVFNKVKDEYLPIKAEAIEKITKTYYALDGMIPELRADKDVILAGVKADGRALAYASKEVKKDEEIVKIAIENYGRAIQWASEDFLNDNKDLCLGVLKNDGFALIYLMHTDLIKDVEVCLTAVEQNDGAFEFVSTELKEKYGDTVEEFVKNVNLSFEEKEEVAPVVEEIQENIKEPNATSIEDVIEKYDLKPASSLLQNELEEKEEVAPVVEELEKLEEEVTFGNLNLEGIFDNEMINTNGVDALFTENNENNVINANVGRGVDALFDNPKEITSTVEDNFTDKQIESFLNGDDISLVNNDIINRYDDLADSSITKEQALEIVAIKGELLGQLNDKFKDDFDVVMKAVEIDSDEIVRKSISPLKSASPRLQDKETIVKQAVEQTGLALKYAGNQPKDNKEIVMLAVADLPMILKEASERLQNDPNVVNLLLENDPNNNAFDCIGFKLKEQFGFSPFEFIENFKNHFDDDKLKAIQEVSTHRWKFYDNEDYRKDKDIVLIQLSTDGFDLKYVDKNLKKDKDVVMTAVAQTGLALQLANKNFRNDPEVVLTAVKQTGYALEFASDELKERFGNTAEEFVKNATEFLETTIENITPTVNETHIEDAEQGDLSKVFDNQPINTNGAKAVESIVDEFPTINIKEIESEYNEMLCYGDKEIIELVAETLSDVQNYTISSDVINGEEVATYTFTVENLPILQERLDDRNFNIKYLPKLELTKDEEFNDLINDFNANGGFSINYNVGEELVFGKPTEPEPIIEETEQSFTYYATQRPISIGTHPKDGLIDFDNYNEKSLIDNINENAWGELHYSRELTQDELSNFDLVKELSPDELVMNSIATQIGEFAKSSVKPIIEDFQNGEFEIYQDYLKDNGADDLLDILNNYIDTQTEPVQEELVETEEENNLTPKQQQAIEIAGWNIRNMLKVPKDMLGDKVVMSELCRRNSGALQWASDELKNDKEFVKDLMKVNARCYAYASDEVKNDKELALELLAKRGYYLSYLPEPLNKDLEIVLFGAMECDEVTFSNLVFNELINNELIEKFGSTREEFVKNTTEFLESQKEVTPTVEDTPTVEESKQVEYTLNVDGKQVKNTDITDDMAIKILNDVMKEVAPKPTKKVKNDYPHRNFKAFNKQFPEILDEKYTTMSFEKDNYMPLHVELIGVNEISISHTYIQNGDVMRDPEMTFKLDIENQRLIPLTFLNDGMGVHQEVFTDDNRYSPQLLKDLSSFTNQWLKNIEQQGRELTQAYGFIDGEEILVVDKSNEVNSVIENTSQERENVGQVEMNRVLEHIEKEEIKADFVDLDEAQVIGIDNEFELEEEVIELIEEQSQENRINYQIKDDKFDDNQSFSPKEKFKSNILAVETLKNIENENRFATPEEQQILSQYVGWGGLADAFDNNKSSWAIEYSQLRDLLTVDEYQDASASTITAFYTPTVVVDSIYKALEDMGLPKDISILDSSAGIGNFLGKAEQSFENCKMSGTELDSITGRIAQQLYQKADIEICGFEKTKYKDNSFDVSVGNVPFGEIKVKDKKYDKEKFLIHDYFFAKNLDKVRDGGVIALVTSKGTLDKENPKIREHIADRADLLGAIRLPNDAFKSNANTNVTSDIIFLQKRESPPEQMPSWVKLGENENGIKLNNYFIENPDMILGEMKMVSGQFGMTATCEPNNGISLQEQLVKAIKNLTPPNEELLKKQVVIKDEYVDNRPKIEIPENSSINDVPNYSFVVLDDKVLFKEDNLLVEPNYDELRNKRLKNPNKIAENISDIKSRITDLIPVRNKAREILDLQTNGCDDVVLKNAQNELNTLYDNFVQKHGYIQDKKNNAFQDDIAYPLLRSLEKNKTVDKKSVVVKADIFNKRTIKNVPEINNVDNSVDALGVCIGKNGKIDLEFMQELITPSKSIENIIEDLEGVIFKNPLSDLDNILDGWETNDEYLSGNVREKLEIAEKIAESRPELYVNVTKLQEIQPTPLKAGEIEVTLGANWIDIDYYKQFIAEEFNLNRDVKYDDISSDWEIDNIKGKSKFDANFKQGNDSKSVTGLKILQDILNKKMTKVNKKANVNGKDINVIDEHSTQSVTRKREDIENTWQNWIFKDPERRNDLVEKYNVIFNSTNKREFDGSHIQFKGMSPNITLRDYQKNAVARNIYGGNTMLAHEVGAGKTFEMIASAMEGKQIGANSKSMIIVPKHIVQQVGADVLELYPNAKLLVAGDKDFTPASRKQFCTKIATNDLDIIILSQEQFEKIPLSIERQNQFIQNELKAFDDCIKNPDTPKMSVKKLETARANLKFKLTENKEKINQGKDNAITFEELGVDKIFVDEAHHYKNLQAPTKMDNVKGISAFVIKSADMLMKCQYLNEKTNEKGICFATGTPITNSISELFTMMRYLQPKLLEEKGLKHFDNWSSVFSKIEIRNEVNSTGTGLIDKPRFFFHNLPELKKIWAEVVDIKRAENLNIPRPNFKTIINPIQATSKQKEIMGEFMRRINDLENRLVSREVDNEGKIFQESRMSSLDPRMIDPEFDDEPNSKVNACINEVFKIYKNSEESQSTQIVFCDMGVPSKNSDGAVTSVKNDELDTMWVKGQNVNVYADIKEKLVEMGVKPDEVAFIHDAKDDKQKAQMFKKVNNGDIRVLIGSTAKMGTGVNVQQKLIALHHLDTPYRPSDIEQRNGRILRNGNENPEVLIHHWLAKGTSEAFMLELVQAKQEMINDIMSNDMTIRTCDDIDETPTLAELKTACIDDPLLQEKMKLENELNKLENREVFFKNDMGDLYERVEKLPVLIQNEIQKANDLSEDIKLLSTNSSKDSKVVIDNVPIEKSSDVSKKIKLLFKENSGVDKKEIGSYCGFKINISNLLSGGKKVILENKVKHSIDVNDDNANIVQRINNKLKMLPEQLKNIKSTIIGLKNELSYGKENLEKPSPYAEKIVETKARISEIDSEMKERDEPKARAEIEQAPIQKKKSKDNER